VIGYSVSRESTFLISRAFVRIGGIIPSRTDKEIQMAQPTPGSTYSVQSGDTLSSIAQHAYGDANEWLKIYNANMQVIGNDPNFLQTGEILHIPFLAPRTCKVTAFDGLNIRAAATSQSTLIASYSTGTTISYIGIVIGENVNGNAHWGRSTQGHYFWLGGTDHPNG
jgi:hypothetical protein